MGTTTPLAQRGTIQSTATTAEQLSLDFSATCTVIQRRNNDGSVTLIPGKIIVVKKDDEITTDEAADLLNIPRRTMQRYVQQGLIHGWQPFANAKWKVSRASVLALRDGQRNAQREASLFD